MTMNKKVDFQAVKTGLVFFPEEVKNEIMKGLKATRYIFNGCVDEHPMVMYTNKIDYINSNLAGTTFKIKSLDINDINREFINFMANFFEKYSQKLASATRAINNFSDDEVADCINKFTGDACIAEVLFDASALDKIINEALKSQSKKKLLEETPDVIDVENAIDINKEIDKEASEGELPVPDEIIDTEEIPDEEVMNDAEIKEEKKEETIVSSSSEAAEGFITDEKLLEKVGDKFFEEAKDKINRIVKNKSLTRKQKKNRINRIVRSYSHKAEDFDPIKEEEIKEKIITETVEDIKKPETTIEEKNKAVIDSFQYPETKDNSFIKKILRDNIKNIILSRVDEDIYKIEMPRKNGFTDMCYISFGKKSFEIGIRHQMTQGAIIIVPMPSNPALGNISVLNEQVFKEVIEVGTMGITQYSNSFISIPFNVKKRAS